MSRKLTGLFAAFAAVVVVVLLAPAVSLAGGCSGVSAVCIYNPQASSGPGGSRPVGGPGGQTPKSVAISKTIASKISRSHTSKSQQKALQGLVQSPSYSGGRHLAAIPPGSVVAPSTLGAAFDIGAGPIALIAIVGGTAVLLLAGTGWRGWRRRRSRLVG